MRHILSFIWRYNFFFLFVVLEVLSMALLANKSYFQRSVITNVTDNMTGSVYNTYSSISSYFFLKKENERLALENSLLWQNLKHGQVTTDTLSTLLVDTLKRQNYTYTVAKVLSNSTNQRNNYIMLNKGKQHGITADMAVVNAQGIVGTVVSVSENFSWVMSILNKHARVSGRIEGLNQMGTVVWQGNDPTKGQLTDIPAHVKIKKGDTITTSGFSHIFPEGIMIGRIETIEVRGGEHFYDIQFKFSSDFNSLSHVYVIKNLFKEEQDELSKEVIDE